jgi:hypothetical protein
MNITGVTGLTEAQKASLRALGAMEEKDEGGRRKDEGGGDLRKGVRVCYNREYCELV